MLGALSLCHLHQRLEHGGRSGDDLGVGLVGVLSNDQLSQLIAEVDIRPFY